MESSIFLLRLATSEDDQPDAAYIANTCNNSLLYALTSRPPISNADFSGIMIYTGAACSSSGNEQQYYNYLSVTLPLSMHQHLKLFALVSEKRNQKGQQELTSLWVITGFHSTYILCLQQFQ